MNKSGALLLLDQFQGQLRVEALDDDVFAAGMHGGHGKEQAGDMKQGQNADMAVVRSQTTMGHVRKVSSDHVTLAEQSAPRLSCNSRRMDDDKA